MYATARMAYERGPQFCHVEDSEPIAQERREGGGKKLLLLVGGYRGATWRRTRPSFFPVHFQATMALATTMSWLITSP